MPNADIRLFDERCARGRAMTSRREFVERAAMSAIGLAVPLPAAAPPNVGPLATPPSRGFLDLLRPPDRVALQTTTGDLALQHAAGERWTNDSGLLVTTAVQAGALHVTLAAPTVAVKRLHLRWRGNMSDARLILGDAWERGYGDMEWRSWIPDRVMPWYFVTYDGSLTHAYGVRTGARALCFWQVDPLGISLWADVRSGAAGRRSRAGSPGRPRARCCGPARGQSAAPT